MAAWRGWRRRWWRRAGFCSWRRAATTRALEAFAGVIAEGLHRARRGGRILATTGAGPDHPVHPHLPESAYLKAQLLQVD